MTYLANSNNYHYTANVLYYIMIYYVSAKRYLTKRETPTRANLISKTPYYILVIALLQKIGTDYRPTTGLNQFIFIARINVLLYLRA